MTRPLVRDRRDRIMLLVTLLVLGALLRLWVATLGSNFDLESYRIVADLVVGGKNVYVYTDRYGYGPVWLLILGLLRQLQLHLLPPGDAVLHLLVTGFLTAVDAALAITLARYWGLRAALVYYLCPVTLLITGFHGQFDNLALLLALWSWLRLRQGRSNQAALLLGLSLMTKHLMVFFPLWLLGWSKLGSWPRRVGFALIAYAVFGAGFLPFALAPHGAAGIWFSVVSYGAHAYRDPVYHALFFDTTLLHRLGLLLPASWPSSFTAAQALWLLLMLASGAVCVLVCPRRVFWLYLLCLVAWSPVVADQYLVIPVLACARLRSWPAWLYLGVASALLLGSGFNVGSRPELAGYSQWVAEAGLRYWHAQVCLVLAAGLALRDRAKAGEAALQ